MTLDRCVQKLRRRLASGKSVFRPGGQKQGMDRTPSFYTSRSIINLSGLGVADPLPDLSRLNLELSHHQFPESLPISPERKSLRSKSPSISSQGSFIQEDPDMWRSINSTDTLPVSHNVHSQVPSSSSRDQLVGSTDKNESASVCKTTTMARFYYKRQGSGSDSQESLGHLKEDEAKQ
jgi:hypothetical protein